MKKQILVKLSNLGDAIYVLYSSPREITYLFNCEHERVVKVYPRTYQGKGDVIVRFRLFHQNVKRGEVCPVKHEEFV
jgi:hypothetical protein